MTITKIAAIALALAIASPAIATDPPAKGAEDAAGGEQVSFLSSGLS